MLNDMPAKWMQAYLERDVYLSLLCMPVPGTKYEQCPPTAGKGRLKHPKEVREPSRVLLLSVDAFPPLQQTNDQNTHQSLIHI